MPLAHDRQEGTGVLAEQRGGERDARPAVRAVRDRDHVGVELGDLLGRRRSRRGPNPRTRGSRRRARIRAPATAGHAPTAPTRSSPPRSSRRTRASAVCADAGSMVPPTAAMACTTGRMPSGRYTTSAHVRSVAAQREPHGRVAEDRRSARRPASRRASPRTWCRRRGRGSRSRGYGSCRSISTASA